MNISEVIKILQEIQNDYGDLGCVIQVNKPNKSFSEDNPIDFYGARESLDSVTTDKAYVFFENARNKDC